jgi:hypothetical protein
MSTAQATSNKAAFKRFHDAVNTGDVELISNTIDELVEPEALIHTPLPIEATGAQLLKQVWAMLLRGLPDPSHHRRGSDRGGGQGRHQGLGYRDPPGRVHGHPAKPANPSRTTRSSSSASQAAESPRPGSRRRPLPAATARRHSRMLLMNSTPNAPSVCRSPRLPFV